MSFLAHRLLVGKNGRIRWQLTEIVIASRRRFFEPSKIISFTSPHLKPISYLSSGRTNWRRHETNPRGDGSLIRPPPHISHRAVGTYVLSARFTICECQSLLHATGPTPPVATAATIANLWRSSWPTKIGSRPERRQNNCLRRHHYVGDGHHLPLGLCSNSTPSIAPHSSAQPSCNHHAASSG